MITLNSGIAELEQPLSLDMCMQSSRGNSFGWFELMRRSDGVGQFLELVPDDFPCGSLWHF
jgi:hypothetical protein